MRQDTYYKVLLVVVLLIVIGFSVHSYLQYRSNKKERSTIKFPPFPSRCPDYWEVAGDGVCKNVKGIGECKSRGDTTMDFNEDDIFQGNKGMYYKCSWSKKCKTPWEGIDNLC